MATKLKSVSYSRITKVVAFFLAAFAISFGSISLISIADMDSFESVIQPDYTQSDELLWELQDTTYNLRILAEYYKSEENVLAGKTISENRFDAQKESLYHKYRESYLQNGEVFADQRDYADEYVEESMHYDVSPSATRNQITSPSVELSATFIFEGDSDYMRDKLVFEKEYAAEIEQMRKDMIQVDLDSYKSKTKWLEKQKNIVYYATDGVGSVLTNTEKRSPDFFTGHQVHYLQYQENMKTSFKHIVLNDGRPAREYNRSYRHYGYYEENQEAFQNENALLYLAFDDDYIAGKISNWNYRHWQFVNVLIIVGVCALVFLLCMAYLIIVAGRRAHGKEVRFLWIDRLFSEITLFALFFVPAMWMVLLMEGSGALMRYCILPFNVFMQDPSQRIMFTLFMILGVVAASLTQLIVLSIVRRLKTRTFIKHALTYIAIKKGVDIIAGFFNGYKQIKYPFQKNIMIRRLLFLGSEIVLFFFTLLFMFGIPPIGVILALVMLILPVFYIKVSNDITKDMGLLVTQIEKIQGGYLSYDAGIPETSALHGASQNLTSISDGLQKSLDTSLRAQRMKVDLVTNISHDLKTPLTSIISYADLLSKEEQLPEHVNDYIRILSQKAARLKVMIQDLFDLSKATSGDIHVDIEPLDYAKLIRQTLADLDETIQKSGLSFRINIPEHSVMIASDGKKMYRVFENLIANALKYSLVGSRVYVDLEIIGTRAVATIKNTANYEMNFDSDEILERFVRGDINRTTEGSGLGLSIAQSFTNACGGEFSVQVDGDLFKTQVSFFIQ